MRGERVKRRGRGKANAASKIVGKVNERATKTREERSANERIPVETFSCRMTCALSSVSVSVAAAGDGGQDDDDEDDSDRQKSE